MDRVQQNGYFPDHTLIGEVLFKTECNSLLPGNQRSFDRHFSFEPFRPSGYFQLHMKLGCL